METNGMDKETVLDYLYEYRKFAIDPECTWNVRSEAWENINDLLDHFNILLKAEVEVEV